MPGVSLWLMLTALAPLWAILLALTPRLLPAEPRAAVDKPGMPGGLWITGGVAASVH